MGCTDAESPEPLELDLGELLLASLHRHEAVEQCLGARTGAR